MDELQYGTKNKRGDFAPKDPLQINPLFRMPMTFTEIFPVGVLVSLITAGLLRKSTFLPAKR